MVAEPERHRRLLEEVAVLYDWIEARRAQEPGRSGRCQACGDCCDFPAYDHRLYVTPPELAYLAAQLGTPELKAMSTGRCPYQQGARCSVHAHRFVGCRIFCCEGDPEFQSELSEEALRRLKAICEELRVPYRYQDLATALAGSNCGTFPSASGAGPADRTS